jgi:acetolactate synthase-1/3 small subunit
VELTAPEEEVNKFINLVKPFGIKEMIRTGKVVLKAEGVPDTDGHE